MLSVRVPRVRSTKVNVLSRHSVDMVNAKKMRRLGSGNIFGQSLFALVTLSKTPAGKLCKDVRLSVRRDPPSQSVSLSSAMHC